MIRFTFRTLAVAVGLLAGVGSTFAVDPAQNLGRYKPADDKKVAAPSAPTADDDTEQIRHRYGYSSNYYGGYRPSYGGYYGGYGRSYYGGGVSFGYSTYYAPRYYTPSYYYAPRYYSPSVYYTPSYYYGGYCGINDTEGAVTLSLSLRPTATREPQRALPSPIEPGTFRYDGGPSQVVPQPTPDAKPMPMPKAEPAAADESLKISMKPKATAAKPTTRYKAYGEK